VMMPYVAVNLLVIAATEWIQCVPRHPLGPPVG
jgi:hypothetical protein